MKAKTKQDYRSDRRRAGLRQIPSVDEVLKYPKIKKLISVYNRSFVVNTVRDVLKETRQAMANSNEKLSRNNRPPAKGGINSGLLLHLNTKTRTKVLDYGNLQEYIAAQVSQAIVQKAKPSLRRVTNATGIILHTGLGRAMLSKKAQEAVREVAGNYCNLEFDLKSGKRGTRQAHVEELICELTVSRQDACPTGESALVVNNNAAAVMLALNTIAYHKEVIIARGQLVEIGGSFRMPEIMKKSECKSIEIGTTNRVTLDDYRKAVTEKTALFLKVHTSNYRIVGFTEEVSLKKLAKLGIELNIPVMYDLGSGALVSFHWQSYRSAATLKSYGLASEPLVGDALRDGADIVTFSADKLLGGPQGGIIIGKKKYIAKMKKNPMARVVRVGKLTLAALETTLREYLVSKDVMKINPTLQIIAKPLNKIAQATTKLAADLERVSNGNFKIEIIDGNSMVGGGSFPIEEIPTKLVAIKSKKYKVDELAKKLRQHAIPIIGRIANEKLLLDIRTVKENELSEIVTAFKKLTADEHR